MNTLAGILLVILALSSPVWVVYLVLMFIRWKEYREELKKPLHRCTVCGGWYKYPDQHNCSGGSER